jgi:colanic acid/amylovoran biosynthesis protein
MLSRYPIVDETYCKEEPYKFKIIKRGASQLSTIKAVISIVKEVDVVVSPWGDGYITTPPHNLLKKSFFLKSSRKPVILFPSSLGPFSGRLKRYLAKKGLERFDRIMARDTVTYKYLNELGFKNVYLIPDTAFILEPAHKNRVFKILHKEGTPENCQFIGLNVSQLLNYLYKEGLGVDYPKFMADLTIYLNNRFNRHILLIPHQIYRNCYGFNNKQLKSYDGDDRFAIRETMKYVQNKEIVTPICGEYNAREYKGIISQCEIFIGARMHSVIAAVSSGVPSVIIQYSHKAQGLMNLVGLSQYVWDYKASKKELFKLIETVWNLRRTLRIDIQSKMVNIKSEAWRAGEILKEVLIEYNIR